jgi:hypothetical protein
MHDIEHFIKFTLKELKLKKAPVIHLVGHSLDQKKTFGIFKPDHSNIIVRTAGRHPVDVMRTIAHELTHLKQKEMGRGANNSTEDEANAMAGRVMRKYDTTRGIPLFKMSAFHDRLKEDATAASVIPANAAGRGGVEGIGVGPNGEPGARPRKTIKVIKSIIRRKMVV